MCKVIELFSMWWCHSLVFTTEFVGTGNGKNAKEKERRLQGG
jgi:hypothetical protein